ncbi:hypothetical protein BASA62_004011 [Batrachochytrium salamandrivorans]|nr:hypothetical protein BASA62_004011 [Batrachochytrium salamandrivorans]
MGRQGARYNAKARASSHLTTLAKPHPKPRDGGIGASVVKLKPAVIAASLKAAANVGSKNSVADDSAQGKLEIDTHEYTSSTTAVPEILPSREVRVASTADAVAGRLAMLTEAQTAKISGKKRKAYGKQSFSSDLFKSSKKLGNHLITAKERLRQALLEERSGVPRSDPTVQLLVPVDPQSLMEEYPISVDMGSNDDHKDSIVEMPGVAHLDGIVSRAFNPPAQSSPVVVISSEHGTTTEENGSNQTSVSAIVNTRPVIGVSLRAKPQTPLGASSSDTGLSEPSKRVLKKRRKLEAQNQLTKNADLGTDSGSDSSDDAELEIAKASESRPRQKSIWASNVVAGEPLVRDTPKVVKPVTQSLKVVPTAVNKPLTQKAVFVSVNRPEEIQISRLALPVVGEEQPIMETILNNDITILCGETGSGKTTQVPQFLYEAGFGDKSHPTYPGMIGVTQPRRVAAVSMASRVAFEMNLHKGEVAYQIRYDKGLVGKNTRIKFMTDGVLLRELSGDSSTSMDTAASTKKRRSDILLSDYSCIIIDEAHERTVGTDVLIGWLTRVVRLRNSGKLQGVKPLRVVIMSATLRVQDFTTNSALFPDGNSPPVIKVDGRQHKVVVHYNKVTPELDYVTEAFKKVSKIHTKLPPGGILVFVTGQLEVQVLVRKLRESFSDTSKASREKGALDTEADAIDPTEEGVFGESEAVAEAHEEDLHSRAVAEKHNQCLGSEHDDFDELEKVDNQDDDEDDEEEDVHVLGGISDDESDTEKEKSFVPPEKAPDVCVLPLYSMLPTKAQMQVFDPQTEGVRLIVIATNVAETSLTIPGIKYVVDCGKVKERRYNAYTGVQTFQVSWASMASADQRAGRAGRMGAGHCYRLFSSAVFNNHFDQFSVPEIMRVPIEDVVMQMKAMGINQVSNFPFPSPPNQDNLLSAERLLKYLGALDIPSNVAGSRAGSAPHLLEITDMGRLMARFPVSPRFSKMLIVAARQSQPILPYIIAIVAGLSVGDPIIRDHDMVTNQPSEDTETGSGRSGKDSEQKEERRKQRSSFFQIMQVFAGASPSSDFLRILNAIGAYSAEQDHTGKSKTVFCEEHFLNSKIMEEIHKLRAQITNLLKSTLANHPSDMIRKSIGDLSTSLRMAPPTPKIQSLIRQILLTGHPDKVARLNESVVAGYGKHAVPVYQTLWGDNAKEHHLVHPSSCLQSQRPAPKWIVYNEVVGKEERMAADNSHVLQMRGSTLTLVDDTNSGEPVRRWLKGCTVVNEPWLPVVCPPSLVRRGHLLTQPEPHYIAKRDLVVGYVMPVFGPSLWELGITETSTDLDMATQIKWFAKALFEGSVVGGMGLVGDKKNSTPDVFKLLGPYMATKASVVTKSWARSQTKVSRLLDDLASGNVATREALVRAWAADRSFLLEAVLAWIPLEFHAAVQRHWPPILRGLVRNQDLYSALKPLLSGPTGENFKLSTERKYVDNNNRVDGSDEDSE